MGYPSSIYSDDDGSFKGPVKEFFKAENINHITTLTHANIAERFIRKVLAKDMDSRVQEKLATFDREHRTRK